MFGTTKTYFNNGTNLKLAIVGGGTAGNRTIGSSYGVAAGDVIQQVIALKLTTTGLYSTSTDITSEFTNPVGTANTVANAGGTDTTGALLLVFFNDQPA